MKIFPIKVWLPIILLFFCLLSCQEESIDASTLDRGEAYFPITSGKYVEYKYDSVFYFNKGIDKVATSGFIREEIGQVISKTEFETKYELLRYWRKKATDKWQLGEVESILKTKEKIVITDENLPFIRLIFPIKEKTTWSGNVLFNDDLNVKIFGEDLKIYNNWEYEFASVAKAFTFNSKKFDDCIEVIETDKTLSLSKRYSRAVYAKDVGMIEREVYIYDTQRPQANQPWENFTDKGYSAKIQYLSHN